MFSFTKRADYALLALSYLTVASERDKDKLVNTKEIAEHFHIPVELLAKILQTLARNNLIASLPGPTGGYRLIRSPIHITVGDIVKIVDGQLGITQCSNGNDIDCDQYLHCTIRNPLSLIEQRMYDLLAEITIKDISQEQIILQKSSHLVTISNIL